MKKIIIALKGASNIGKTSTIKKVRSSLLERYVDASQEVLIDEYDINVIITISGVKIGIESQGDPNSRLEKSLEKFSKAGCTIIVCATRTRGMTVNWVKSLQPNYDVIWKNQKYLKIDTEQEKSNDRMSKEIVESIIKLL